MSLGMLEALLPHHATQTPQIIQPERIARIVELIRYLLEQLIHVEIKVFNYSKRV